MQTSTREIRQDIERTRGDLGETLEAFGDKVAPKKVVGRAKEKVADKVEDAKERVSPRRIVRRGVDRARSVVTGTSDDHQPALSRGSNGARRNSASSRGASSARARGRELAEQTSDTAGSVVGSARSAPRAVWDKAEGNPLAAGLIAFGGGLAIAALIRSSDREQGAARTVKERVVEPVKRQAVEAGRAVAHELQPAAQHRAEQVKERANEAAQHVRALAQSSAQQLKSETAEATEEVAVQAKDAAQTVKGEAKRSAATVKNEAKRTARSVKGQATTSPAPRRRRPAAAGASAK